MGGVGSEGRQAGHVADPGGLVGLRPRGRKASSAPLRPASAALDSAVGPRSGAAAVRGQGRGAWEVGTRRGPAGMQSSTPGSG